MAKTTFDKILLDAIDDSFRSLGESAKQAIYFHLENKFGLGKKDIPRNLVGFERGLEKIFGAGARFLQILIMKNLYGKLDQPLKWDESKELAFVAYVNAAKKSLAEKKEG